MNFPNLRRTWPNLLICVVATFAAALIGGLAASSSRETYAALELPAWAPPGSLFGPVWTVLYILIAIAGWILWNAGSTRALVLWFAQLVLNALWTPLFFAAEQYELALVEIVVLALVVAALIATAWKIARPAAWMLLPYLAWVCFATALNTAIVVLN